MKTVYYILLCCSCLVLGSCQPKNKKAKTDLNVSLLFYPSLSIENIIYSVDIIGDSLTVKKCIDSKEESIKLTGNQVGKIKEMISALNQKYDRSGNFVLDGWGCTLKMDNQVYYADNFFSFAPQSKAMGWQPPPEEIKSLIDYIVSLSPIPIDLYGFA